MVRFSFAGHEFAALGEGALFWPKRRALLVADLHLEKASWFAARGQLLPPYDSAATVDALHLLTDRLEPAEIWCLGDSFHDREGCERLPRAVQARLRSLIAETRWTWITGNHDAEMIDRCGGDIAVEAKVEGITLRHEADPADPDPELSGHFHPKLRLRLRGRQVSRRCFVAGPTKIILPAFGALTGGLDAGHPEIIRAIGSAAQALVPVEDRLLRFSLAA